MVEHNISGCEKARDERGGEDDRLSRRVDVRRLVTEWNPRLSTRATDVLMVHDVVWRFMSKGVPEVRSVTAGLFL